MENSETNNIVHEAEAQRRYARVQMPISLLVPVPSGGVQQFKVSDISMGGFSLDSESAGVDFSNARDGVMSFQLDNFTLRFAVKFQLKASNTDGHLGFEFHNLDARDVSALRYMITAFLSGELVQVGDVLHTISRDNFVKERQPVDDSTALFSKVKVLFATVLFFAIGLIAISLVTANLFKSYFVTDSETGVFVSDVHQVTMPTDGIFNSLVAVDQEVKLGAVLGSFESPVNALLGETGLDSSASLGLKGTLTSPCDCVVSAMLASDQSVLGKGAAVFSLAAVTADPTVVALFDLEAADNLPPSTLVDVRVLGTETVFDGEIMSVRLHQDALSRQQLVEATIKLNAKPPSSHRGRPVTVTKQQGLLSTLFDALSVK